MFKSHSAPMARRGNHGFFAHLTETYCERFMGLGALDQVSLVEAREARDRARAVIRSGHDPIEERAIRQLAIRVEERMRSPAHPIKIKASDDALIFNRSFDQSRNSGIASSSIAEFRYRTFDRSGNFRIAPPRMLEFEHPTFDGCAIAYIEAHRAAWRSAKHLRDWRSSLATRIASPIVGGRRSPTSTPIL